MNLDELRPILAASPRVCSVERCGKPHLARGWCGTHYARWRKTGELGGHRTARWGNAPHTVKQRFWAKVSLPTPDGCLLWLGGLDSPGYGKFKAGESNGMAHRFSYELLVGPIPEGLTIDHLCRVRNCVNPDHLEPVTFLVNMRRRYSDNPDARETHCRNSHELTPENTYGAANGQRRCRVCASERKAASQ